MAFSDFKRRRYEKAVDVVFKQLPSLVARMLFDAIPRGESFAAVGLIESLPLKSRYALNESVRCIIEAEFMCELMRQLPKAAKVSAHVIPGRRYNTMDFVIGIAYET